MVFIHGMTRTYIHVRPWITLFLMLSYRTHRRASTPNTTITTTSVNFKKLKGDLGSMSLTHVFWEMCAFSVQTPLWPFHTWFETPINSPVSLSEKYGISHFMPLSCCWLLVGKVSSSAWGNHYIMWKPEGFAEEALLAQPWTVWQWHVILFQRAEVYRHMKREKYDWIRDCERRLLMEIVKCVSC